MDNEPEPQQEQKKEKSLNQYASNRAPVDCAISDSSLRLLTSKMVDIYVGPESAHWPIHERLLCYHSPFFSSIFYDDEKKDYGERRPSRGNKSYGLPEEEEYTFELLVGWLYSRSLKTPKVEKDIAPLLDLYLLSEKLEMKKLSLDIVDAVREYYHTSNTYPGLRRLQYVYAETDEDNEMREMMVSSVARQLATGDKIPMHWAKALQRNGQLALDIIRAIQQWHLEERSIPDVRDGSIERGRAAKGGFSAVDREGGESVETVDTNLGVESIQSGTSDGAGVKSDGEE